MGDLSVFVDESGDMDAPSKYYLLSLVIHDQNDPLDSFVAPYVKSLVSRGLPDVAFHMNPLMRGNEEYRAFNLPERKSLFHGFRVFAEHLAFNYAIFAYQKSHLQDDAQIAGRRIERDLSAFLKENLSLFQAFSSVKLYYDNGQNLIAHAIRAAFENALGCKAVVFRDAPAGQFRLAQVADYVCGVELVALKYQNKEESATDRLFFGGSQSFKKNVLRKLRLKRLN